EISRPTAQIFQEIAEGKLFKATGIVEGSLEISFGENGNYSFSWPEAGKCRGKFTKITINRSIQFTWVKSHAAYAKDGFETLVDIQLAPNKEQTQLTLTHGGFQQKEAYDSHLEGWREVLNDFSVGE